jgi:hypothetical protein
MPLLPREAKLSLDREGVIQWKSLLGALPVEPGNNPQPDHPPSNGEGVVIDVKAVESKGGK